MAYNPIPTGTAGSPNAAVVTVQGVSSMTAVKVDGSAVTQPISGNVGVTGSVAVTGTFWQATQPVSGTVTANAGTGTFAVSAASLPLPTGASTETTLAAMSAKLPTALGQTTMANSLAVTFASNQSALNVSPDNILDNLTTTGSASSATNIVSVANAGFNGGSFHITANASSNTVSFEQSNDNTNWVMLLTIPAVVGSSPVTTSNGTGVFNFSSSAAYVRARISTFVAGFTSVSLTQKRNAALQAAIPLNIGPSGGTFQIGTVAVTGTVSTTGSTTAATAIGGQAGIVSMGSVTTAAPGYTNATANWLSLTTGGGLRSDIASYNGTALTGTVTAYGTAPTGNVFGVNAFCTTLANGQTAHSSASTGSPVRVAGRVNTAVDTTLVAGDASDIFMTTSGAQVVKPYAVPEVDWQATSGLTPLATTTSTVVKTAGAAGVRNYTTAIQLFNNSATVSTNVAILDGATVLWAGWLPATTASLPVVPVNINFPTPLRGTAATAVNIQLGTTSASVFWNAQGYQAA